MARGVGFGVRGMFCGNGKRGFYYGYHNGISRKLASAGNPQGINADEYIGFGIIMFVGSGVFGVLFNLIFELDEYLSLYGAFALWGILAAMWWRAWLARKKDDRQTSIRKMLPFSLDLLTLSIEAGLDFTSSLQRIVRKIGKNPLGQEFALMLHEVQLGKSRTQALRDFANRADVAEVRTVVASLIQAEELGASMGPILRIQAQQQRERRSQRAEEQAMKAPVKMLFPLTVFIFPTVLIMLFVPIALKVWA
jgi:tight adherence protein C